jgi:RNase P subunit RPR2
MADTTVQQNTLKVTCPCGQELTIEARLLGRIMKCASCGRYLRPALQFLLVDKDRAPNLTVQCGCGHFVVEKPGRAGKRSRCPVCKGHLIMPQPVVKFGSEGVIRVPRKVLENQLRRVGAPSDRHSKEVTRLETAAQRGRISLRPGEHICVNPECGALLSPGANVCAKCGTNRLTGQLYEGPGPEKDPMGKWREV